MGSNNPGTLPAHGPCLTTTKAFDGNPRPVKEEIKGINPKPVCRTTDLLLNNPEASLSASSSEQVSINTLCWILGF